MPEFRYTALTDDVIKASLQEAQDCTWLIYPTERSCRSALQAFQEQWQPLQIRFLSMDEFKQTIIYSGHICLQDEKRLVCLYQAMTAEDRAVFHIEKYPDLIDWGQHFFELWEDLAEECVDADALLQRFQNNDLSFQEWQYINYTRMLAIRRQYHEFISGKGFTDVIFDKQISNLHPPEDIRRFIFVNQFYYSQLEQTIIGQIEARRFTAIVIWQGQVDWLDEHTLHSGELVLAEAFPDPALPFKLKVFESTNHWQMALSFLQNFKPEPGNKHFIIDAEFLKQPYHQVFARDYFRWAEPVPFHQTELCHFLQTLGKGLANLLYDNGKLLVRLDWLLQAIGMEGFITYFRPDWDAVQIDNFNGFVCKFSENDFLYLDLKLKVIDLVGFAESTPDNISMLKDIMALLQHLSRIDSVRALTDAIDTTYGVRVKALLDDEEKTCTTLLECFYEGLANFLAMDELALVDDWQALYPGMPVSAGVFDLFLSFIKPRKYKINRKDDYHPTATLTNLLDTRNLQADKLTFLNMTEKVLPSGRTPVWLFNEKQRQAIGLKTWDDIRNWERHYFYRLIAGAKEVEFYTLVNQDKDIEPSSFLSELYHFAQGKTDSENVTWQETIIPADTLLKNRLKTDPANPLTAKKALSDLNSTAFFSLPYIAETDISQHRMISLSWSMCNHFLNNPFLYYLQDIRKIRERIFKMEETLGRRMFGKLLHNYLMVVTQRLSEQHNGTLSMRWEWINADFLKKNLEHALTQPLLAYQLPANYNRQYMSDLLSPFLIDTAAWFFHNGLGKEKDFENQVIKLIPESEISSRTEQLYKVLLRPDETPHDIGFQIRGRADLRLETSDKRFIIDFKTGSYDELQLLFYKWFYYLIEQPELDDSIRTAFYKLLDKDMDWLELKKSYQKDKLKTALLEALDTIVSRGYTPDEKGTSHWDAVDITRVDLLGNITFDEEQE